MKRAAADESVGDSLVGKRTRCAAGCGAPTSNESPTSARGDRDCPRSTASCYSNSNDGFETSLPVLRSVLHHPLGFPLACYLHGSDVFQRARARCPELVRHVEPLQPRHDHPPTQQQPPRRGDFDALLREACVDWLLRAGVAAGNAPSEPALTGNLLERMRRALAPHGMTCKHSGSAEAATGKPDIMVREAIANRHPVLTIEVGLSNSGWWQTMDQILKYLVGLRDQDETFTQPVLLCALTIETDGGCVFTGGRIGTFLATCPAASSPTHTKDFSLAMLRRVETTDLTLLSAEFAKVVRAASGPLLKVCPRRHQCRALSTFIWRQSQRPERKTWSRNVKERLIQVVASSRVHFDYCTNPTGTKQTMRRADNESEPGS
jgi:hypothetical protein